MQEHSGSLMDYLSLHVVLDLAINASCHKGADVLLYHHFAFIFNISGLLLLLLSHVSHVQLCVTPQMVAHQAPIPGTLQARTLEWVSISFSGA